MTTTPSRFYLGIDPALLSTGVAIVGPETCSVIVSCPKDLKEGARLKYHVDRLREFVKNYGEIQAACIEGPSLRSQNRADDMGQIRGTFMYVLAELGIETAKIPPNTLKKYATGNGSADKERMVRAAQKKWPGVQFKTDDAADAAWLAALAQALHEDVRVTASQLAVLRGIRFANPKPIIRLRRKNNI
jgi:Holliday junction resolvasome RuvABC endonuclease subunit